MTFCRRLPECTLAPNIYKQPWGRCYSHYIATQAAQQSLSCYRGVCKARKVLSKVTKLSSLLANYYSVWTGLSMPSLIHGFLLPFSDANECSPCIELQERNFRGWDSVVFCRIKYLPQQQEAAQLGTVSNFKVRCFCSFFLT